MTEINTVVDYIFAEKLDEVEKMSPEQKEYLIKKFETSK